MRATPAKMKIARITSAPRIPQNSTRCCWCGGTPKAPKSMTITKMLSTLSAFSIRYPVVNSSPRWGPKSRKTPRANTAASPIHTALQTVASRREMACALRWNTPRSRASIRATKARKPTHRGQLPSVATDSIVRAPPGAPGRSGAPGRRTAGCAPGEAFGQPDNSVWIHRLDRWMARGRRLACALALSPGDEAPERGPHPVAAHEPLQAHQGSSRPADLAAQHQQPDAHHQPPRAGQGNQDCLLYTS